MKRGSIKKILHKADNYDQKRHAKVNISRWFNNWVIQDSRKEILHYQCNLADDL